MKWIKKAADFKPIGGGLYLIAFLEEYEPYEAEGAYWDYAVVWIEIEESRGDEPDVRMSFWHGEEKFEISWDDVEYYIPTSQMNPTINC